MAPSLTAKTINATSKLVSAALASQGFKRKGQHLVRPSQDVLHGIHFQSSQWGTASEGRFTVNLVVTAPALYEAWTGKAPPTNPATASYPIQQRIGFCLQSRTDMWWTIGPETNTESLAHEAAAVIAQHSPDFLATFPNMQAILAQLRQTGNLPGLTQVQAALVHAYLAQRVGASSEAKALLLAALESAKNSPFKATIRSFAHRAGIPI